jgi:hypothetical protein
MAKQDSPGSAWQKSSGPHVVPLGQSPSGLQLTEQSRKLGE